MALAAVPGCRALATSSGAVARSLGYPDGEQIPRAEMLEVVRRIAAAVEIPVTADLEAGYGDAPGTAALALDAGAVGMNLEDSIARELLPLERQVETIRAVRAAAPPVVLNARVDVYIRHLRSKIDDKFSTKMIHTVRGIGYMLDYPDTSLPGTPAEDVVA